MPRTVQMPDGMRLGVRTQVLFGIPFVNGAASVATLTPVQLVLLADYGFTVDGAAPPAPARSTLAATLADLDAAATAENAEDSLTLAAFRAELAATAAATPAKTLIIGPVRQYYPAGGPTSFPGQLRPYEPTRRFAIIRNHAPVTVMQIGIQTNPANSYNAPGSYPYSIPPGGSLVLANQTGAILARAQTSGQVWHCSTETHLAVI